MTDADTIEREKTEETFELNGDYIAGQAREAMRIFFLPMSSVVKAARSQSRKVKREARRRRAKAA